jgi:hypothetical protein
MLLATLEAPNPVTSIILSPHMQQHPKHSTALLCLAGQVQQ